MINEGFSGKDFISTRKPQIVIPQARGAWDRTQIMESRLSPLLKRGFFEEKGKDRPEHVYQERPVIHRDTRINGGVYLGAFEREAIVVDDIKQRGLRRLYGRLWLPARIKKLQSRITGAPIDAPLVRKVFDIVNQKMRYDEEAVNAIPSKYNLKPDEKVALEVYMREGIGVCRHQALLAGYLLEKLIDKGFLKGQVSIDRNTIPGKGGHVWARYQAPDKTIYIIDVAQGFAGKLQDAMFDETRWFYERPEDVAGGILK